MKSTYPENRHIAEGKKYQSLERSGPFVIVRVTSLSETMRDLIETFSACGDEIADDGCVIIESRYKENPAEAPRIFNFAWWKYDEKTELPLSIP